MNYSKEWKRHYWSFDSELYGVCVFDDPNDRVLKEHFFTSPELTIEMCLGVCRDKGFRYSGLQWQIECHCGNEPAQGFQWAWFGKCNDKCAGNSNQVCGGSQAMSVYTTRVITKLTSIFWIKYVRTVVSNACVFYFSKKVELIIMNTPSKTPRSSFDGLCIYDSPSQRVLNEFVVTGNANMTIKSCKETCQGRDSFLIESLESSGFNG